MDLALAERDVGRRLAARCRCDRDPARLSARCAMKALALFVVLAGCQNLDSFFYSPRHPDNGYDFDGIDPDLDGDLTDPHPSIVPAADREEGMLALDDGTQIHYVLARHPGAT